jgi:putative Mg2+ transporter-C (MgtC) family protein
MAGFVFELQLLGHVVLAMVLGALVGLEREYSDKPAGLRTHMLVCGAAALLVSVSTALIEDFDDNIAALRVDPIRVIEAVVAGVSFLGAGTIFRRGGESHIEGLTTAASLLFVAGVGVCVAADRIILAVGATILVFLVLHSHQWLSLPHSRAAPPPDSSDSGSTKSARGDQ